MLNGVPRILIVRLSAIGDVVRVLPALHSLREAFPSAQIDWAVERKAADVVLGHPALDQVHVFERPEGAFNSMKSFAAFARMIRGCRYEQVIDFHGIFKSGLITRASGAPQRFGFARPRSRDGSWLFTNRKVRLESRDLSRTEENLQLVELVAPRHESLELSMAVSEEIQEAVESYFAETFEGAKRVVAMHVPVEREEKRWPPEHFAALTDMLLSDGRFEVVLTWGPGQQSEVEAVAGMCRRTPKLAPATNGLKHYIWLVHCADLYFGGDTGPMHIASAMGTDVVAVFGGTDPRKHGPARDRGIALTADSVEGAVNGLSAAEKLQLITPDRAYDACVELTTRRISRNGVE